MWQSNEKPEKTRKKTATKKILSLQKEPILNMKKWLKIMSGLSGLILMVKEELTRSLKISIMN